MVGVYRVRSLRPWLVAFARRHPNVLRFGSDVVRLLSTVIRLVAQLAAEHLFVRKQLALYVQREVKPRRVDAATRIADRLAPYANRRQADVRPPRDANWAMAAVARAIMEIARSGLA